MTSYDMESSACSDDDSGDAGSDDSDGGETSICRVDTLIKQ